MNSSKYFVLLLVTLAKTIWLAGRKQYLVPFLAKMAHGENGEMARCMLLCSHRATEILRMSS